MAEGTLEVEIVTPEKAVFRGEASQVIIPGEVGEIGVLPGHLPLLTQIKMGDLRVDTTSAEGRRRFWVEGGYAEILPDKVSILTEACDGVDSIDVAGAREALAEAEKAMSALEDKSRSESVEADIRKRHEDRLERARRRLLVAQDGDS